MIQAITLKQFVLLMLIIGAAFVPQEKILIYGATGAVVWYIIDTCINYNQTKEQLNEQLLQAAHSSDLKTIKNHLVRGANTEANKHGQTPLIIACYKQNPEIVQFLVNAGAHIEKKDNYGRTALIAACFWASGNNIKIIKILMNAGANPFTQDKHNKTAYDYALSNNDSKTTQYLWKIKNKFIRFKTDPRTCVIALKRPQNYLKMMYKISISCYDIDQMRISRTQYFDNTRYTDLSFVFAKLHNSCNNEKLKKLIDACEFSKYSKDEREKLKKFGFPLSVAELTMQENFLENITQSTSFDLTLLYINGF